MKKFFFSLSIIITLFLGSVRTMQAAEQPSWWNFQAIDTMKFSRDPSRQFLSHPDQLDDVIAVQVPAIAATGATHIAIATPYDDEFLPILKKWVTAARQQHLKIWFRGNWSGWESWFGYPRISRADHLSKTITFIKTHPELFEDGDVFSACPECENGGPGDPRMNGDARGHREFLINEYKAMTEAFRGINRNVQVNFNSMNGDVARLIMDKETTQALGGIVVIDHYVRTPEQLSKDVTDIAAHSGGKVILGEFGAPIPDIHGTMSDQEQANWISRALNLLAQNPALTGLSYWTSVGGSTAIWTDTGKAKPAVAVLHQYFIPQTINITFTNTLGQTMRGMTLSVNGRTIPVEGKSITIPYLDLNSAVTFTAPEYETQTHSLTQLKEHPSVALAPAHPGLWYRFRAWLHQAFPKL